MRQIPAWQTELGRAISDPAELLALLELDQQLLAGARGGAGLFPMRVPRGYAARMQRGNPDDPLLRQVLPLAQETSTAPNFSTDPVGDLEAMAVPGVLHKYHGRVLVVATGACAVHCRYCFRRHFPYAAANPSSGHWQAALDYIESDRGIHEVILSGGDPLSLADAKLAGFVAELERIEHVRRLRLHTRLPVVLPERVTAELLQWLGATRLQPVMVIHANHANELDGTVGRALARLRGGGITLLNQAVLLAGVNDSVDALRTLSERLFETGVLPYYLHLLDRVLGAAHYEVEEIRARQLAGRLAATLPGYLVPRLVRENIDAPAKQPLSYYL
jgi:EF-P beta-lysylation protein EpmB